MSVFLYLATEKFYRKTKPALINTKVLLYPGLKLLHKSVADLFRLPL
jgi:hypothetical protein